MDEKHLNKAQRLVRITELMQQGSGVTAAQLMARFDLDDRTLRRYISDLQGLDLPLRTEGRGAGRRFWIDASYRRAGVKLTLLELVSLHFGRNLFNFLQGTGFAQDMDEALETLSTLGVDMGKVISADLDRKFMAVPEHRKDHSDHSEMLDEVLTALLYQNPVKAHYARLSGPMRTYTLHPYTLATFRQGLYLFALDVDVGRIKTYALDRFHHFERVRREHFQLPADYHPSQVIEHAFGIIDGPIADVVLEFNRRAAPYIRERIWHHTQQTKPLSGGGVRLEMKLGIAHELVSWILGFGPDVRVVGPEALARQVRQLHEEAIDGWQDRPARPRRDS